MSTTVDTASAVCETGAPTDRPREQIDVRTMGPPAPFRKTLDRLSAVDDDTVLVQVNDREPRLLFPELVERGYEYGLAETDDGAVVTVVWRP